MQRFSAFSDILGKFFIERVKRSPRNCSCTAKYQEEASQNKGSQASKVAQFQRMSLEFSRLLEVFGGLVPIFKVIKPVVEEQNVTQNRPDTTELAC